MVQIVKYRRFEIPSCKLSKEAIREMGEVIESAYKIANEDVSMVYALNSREKSISSQSITDFTETKWPRDIRLVSMYSKSSPKDVWIQVKIGERSDDGGYCEVKGEDGVWVSGLSKKIEEVLNENKTINSWFHQRLYFKGFVYFLLSVLFLSSIFPSSVPTLLAFNTQTLPSYFVLSLFLVFILNESLKWLFPYVEFEDCLIQTRIRKYIIAPVLLGLVITIISRILPL